MLQSEREKLYSRESEYLSIGITADGKERNVIGVPWESTAHAFNMRRPNVYLEPRDLTDKEIMDRVRSFKVIGCYVWAPLEDYGFVGEFKEIEDIYIINGDSIRELGFLTRCGRCRMLYLQNAALKDLDVVVNMKSRAGADARCFLCVCLDNCTVEDASVFERERVYFSEFLIFAPKGRDEREKWRAVTAGKKRYYEFE